jgi:hypothetical protein
MYYHGHGWCAGVFFLGAVLTAHVIRTDLKSQWLGCALVVFTAVLLGWLGYALNHRRPVEGDQHGNLVTHKPYHALWWIPVEYWALITLVVGIGVVYF